MAAGASCGAARSRESATLRVTEWLTVSLIVVREEGRRCHPERSEGPGVRHAWPATSRDRGGVRFELHRRHAGFARDACAIRV